VFEHCLRGALPNAQDANGTPAWRRSETKEVTKPLTQSGCSLRFQYERNPGRVIEGQEGSRRGFDGTATCAFAYEKDEEIHAYRGIFDDRLHGFDVGGAWICRKAGVRMPFAQVIESCVIFAGTAEKALQLPAMPLRVTHESCVRSAGALYRDLDDTEQILTHVFR